MKTVSLDDCPEYTALSYTWGDPSPTSLLIIGNHIIRTTKSVETALLHLQDERETITLWIDQLCINQDDNVEKGEQVQLMKAIYQTALGVVVWLGPAADESDQLIDILSEAGEEAFESRLMQLDLSDEERYLEYTDSYNRLVKRLGQEPTFPIECLRSFVNRPYWTQNLPTWVPDWSAPLQNPYGIYFTPNTRTFSASGKKSACVTSTGDLNRLITLRGAVVDEVATIGSAWVVAESSQFDEETGVTSQFLTEIDRFCNEASHLDYQGPGVLSEARWRTAIGDKEATDRGTTLRATSLSRKGHEDVLSRLETRKMNRAIQMLSQDQIDHDRLPVLGKFSPIGKEERS